MSFPHASPKATACPSPVASPLPLVRLCLVVLMLAVLLAGCSSSRKGGGTGPGGYPIGAGDYRNDGPHPNPPPNLHLVPDAVPKVEPLASGPNRPYVISGRRYVPDTSWKNYRAQGRASWYGRQFHGRPTSSGEPYDMYAMTAAHPTLPIPSYVRVTNTRNQRSVIVRVNDRGPFVDSRIIDLSYVAALKLGTLSSGTGDVVVELITPQQILAGTWQKGTSASASLAPTPIAQSNSGHSHQTSVSQAFGQPSAQPVSQVTSQAIASHRPQVGTQPVIRTTAQAATPTTNPLQTSSASATTTWTDSVYLQLGAFGAMVNAQALANRLAAHQSGGRVVEVRQSPDQLYRVRLGPYANRQQAMAEVETIYTHTGIMPHVVAP